MDFVSMGIEGLDEMLGSGVPKGHTITVMGPFGTGKTTFGLQFLWKGLQENEKGIFITLEEDVGSILEDALSFGWNLEPYVKGKQLAMVKLEPADARSTLTKVKSELPSFIKSQGATRIVIDSVSLLNMMFEGEAQKRAQLFNLCRKIKETNATSVFTAESNASNPRLSRDGLAEYISDGVISLQFQEMDSGEVQLVLQVVKMRRVKHSRRIKPYSITEKGIVVHSEVEVF